MNQVYPNKFNNFLKIQEYMRNTDEHKSKVLSRLLGNEVSMMFSYYFNYCFCFTTVLYWETNKAY